MEHLLRWLEANDISVYFERRSKDDPSTPLSYQVNPLAWVDDFLILATPDKAQRAVDLVVAFFKS